MSKFIKLHNVKNVPVYVNLDAITHIEESTNGETILWLGFPIQGSPNAVIVKETPKEIFQLPSQ